MKNKELLAEVLKIKDIPESVVIDEKYVYVRWGEEESSAYNIYELAEIFEEWANRQGYKLVYDLGNLDIHEKKTGDLLICLFISNKIKFDFYPHLVFRACEWIYKKGEL